MISILVLIDNGMKLDWGNLGQNSIYAYSSSNAKFNFKSQLTMHAKTHDSLKNQCELCQKEFKTKGQMNRHVKHIHGAKKYPCQICSTLFSSLYGLNNHVKYVHNENNDQRHKCVTCEKEFKRKDCLRAHIKTHNTDRQTYSCELCLKKFFSKRDLKRHFLVHEVPLEDA